MEPNGQKNEQKILLVEDDGAISLGLEYSLSQEGYRPVLCGAVSEALNVLEQQTFDLALLDLTLPDGSGYEICREIKRRGDTPVIFLTARDDEVNVVMGLDMGADDYIVKPFRVRELLSRIRTVLRRAGRPAGGTLEYGDVQISPAQGRVTRNGQDVFLTALEYRLLMTLVNHEGRVLSRSQLLESIWDVSGDFVNDNTLTVYIKRLREKIEDNPQDPRIIKTVRGMGYRIDGRPR
ncbi:MAG TPA: response regulator transcription factor [Firmicutes bacterium]|nr:response regulator transcription factor [Bacillota bacterium]